MVTSCEGTCNNYLSCWNLIIAVRVAFGPPESAPVVFHACFIVFAVTFSFPLLEHNQLGKRRVVSQ